MLSAYLSNIREREREREIEWENILREWLSKSNSGKSFFNLHQILNE